MNIIEQVALFRESIIHSELSQQNNMFANAVFYAQYILDPKNNLEDILNSSQDRDTVIIIRKMQSMSNFHTASNILLQYNIDDIIHNVLLQLLSSTHKEQGRIERIEESLIYVHDQLQCLNEIRNSLDKYPELQESVKHYMLTNKWKDKGLSGGCHSCDIEMDQMIASSVPDMRRIFNYLGDVWRQHSRGEVMDWNECHAELRKLIQDDYKSFLPKLGHVRTEASFETLTNLLMAYLSSKNIVLLPDE